MRGYIMEPVAGGEIAAISIEGEHLYDLTSYRVLAADSRGNQAHHLVMAMNAGEAYQIAVQAWPQAASIEAIQAWRPQTGPNLALAG